MRLDGAVLLLAGGTGAAPLVAVLQAAATALRPKAWLFARFERRGKPSALEDEVAALGRLQGFEACAVSTSGEGEALLARLPQDRLAALAASPSFVVLASGPPGFVRRASAECADRWPLARCVAF